MRAEVLRLAALPKGFRCEELPDEHEHAVRNCTKRLLADGLLHRVQLSHKNVRYWTDLKTAEAARAKTILTLRVVRIAPRREGWGPEVCPIITKDTKYTIAPPPPRCWRTNTFSNFGG
jgi:hypothetical protein